MMTMLLVVLLSQSQTQITNTGLAAPVATRCVNAAGTAFESCAGSASSSWAPDGGAIGSVTVSNFPAPDGGDLGRVVVSNFPAPDGGFIGSVTVANFPAPDGGDLGRVVVSNFPAPDGGFIGSVTVSNFPAPDGGALGSVVVSNPVTYVNAAIDGGVIISQGVDPGGTPRSIAVDQSGVQFITVLPRNNLIPRCTPLRRIWCQP